MTNKFYLLFFLTICFTAKAQSITNQLEGYFKNTKKDHLYSSIHLNGNGHALINNSFPAEYFIKENILYILPDKSVFVFEIDKNKIKGISNWVNKQTFKQVNTPLDNDEEKAFEDYIINPELLYQYYIYNFSEGTDEVSWLAFENPQAYLTKMESLCNQGLTTACGALFGMKYLESAGGLNAIFETVKLSKNSELEKIANQIIDLKDTRGYTLLGSYYLGLGETEKAKQILSEGADRGDLQAALALFEIEITESLDETSQEDE